MLKRKSLRRSFGIQCCSLCVLEHLDTRKYSAEKEWDWWASVRNTELTKAKVSMCGLAKACK